MNDNINVVETKDEKIYKLLEYFCKLTEEEKDLILEKAITLSQENKSAFQPYDG